MIKKEIEDLEKNIKDEKQRAKEEEWLKKGIIERLIDSKEILDVEHPITGEDITEKNLSTLNINQLLELMEENADACNMVTNGKTE